MHPLHHMHPLLTLETLPCVKIVCPRYLGAPQRRMAVTSWPRSLMAESRWSWTTTGAFAPRRRISSTSRIARVADCSPGGGRGGSARRGGGGERGEQGELPRTLPSARAKKNGIKFTLFTLCTPLALGD
jgi:hypothetical protein